MQCTPPPERELDELASCIRRTEQPNPKCWAMAEDMGLEEIGGGVSRIVYSSTDDCVVLKFARGHRESEYEAAVEVNRRETENWENLPDGLRDWFVPIIDHDEEYQWVMMPEVETPTGRDERFPFEEEQAFKRSLDRHGWYCADIRPSNFGKDDGDWKFFDYPECVEEESRSTGEEHRYAAVGEGSV